MKTVFLTIFEGVESKNIVRTDILKTLLKHPDIRLVLFTKSSTRVAYLQKEFNDPRISYEVVDPRPVRGLDKLFMRLKFLLLRTGTMSLRRRMRLQASGNYVGYWVSSAANWIFARSLIRRLFRQLDYTLIKNREFAPFFKIYQPDLVLLASIFDEQELNLLREARRQGVPSVAFINSWDRPTARCILRQLADKFVVFNELVKKEIMEHDEVREEDIFVGGIPQYDQYVSLAPWSREQYFKKIGRPAHTRLIVYSPIGSAYSNSDWDFIDLLHRMEKEGKFGADASVLVRFPPNDFIPNEELARRPWLFYDYPGVRFSDTRGVDWDMTFPELEHLANTLHHMSLLICYASSISVDASVLDKPVINIDFEVKDNILLSKSPTQFYQMTHYKKALDTGGIRLVKSKRELVEWVRKYLENPALDREGRRQLARQQCAYMDGKSGERIGKFVLSLLENSLPSSAL